MAQRPNILLITTDQQRADSLGIAGRLPVLTPNLDWMARAGTNFRRGHAECPSCFPSRRTLMTGMAPAAQGMIGMAGKDWDPPHTLAGELARAGYQTQLSGKLHLQPPGKRFGFEHMHWSDGPYIPNDEYSRWLRDVHGRREVDSGIAHGLDVNGWVGRPTHLPEDQTHTYWCINNAIDFLEYRRDPTQPFFLNVSLFDPHPPLAPPAFYYDRYVNMQLPPPATGNWNDIWNAGPEHGLAPWDWRINLDPHQQHCMQAAYYATVNFIDDQIGRLLQYLRRTRLFGNTFILFTSDHGEMLGDHHLYRKCWAYEGSTNVPFLALAPWLLGGKDQRAPATPSDQPVGLQDVLPTLLDVAGAPIPTSCTGRSLWPMIQGQNVPVRDVLHGEHAQLYEYADGNHYLVSDRYKYIWYSQRPVEHLFDLREDPTESRDLALEADAEERLGPWRERLVEVLANRPEGFVQNGRLTVGQPHDFFIPDYEPDRFYPYL